MRQQRLQAILTTSVVAGFAIGIDMTICPTAGLFGIPCPSCGLTRASLALVRGDLRGAFLVHPGVFAVCAYLLAAAVMLALGRKRAVTGRAMCTAGGAILIGLLLLWGARAFGYFGGPVTVVPWAAQWR